MIYVYGAFPLGISFANICFSFTQKKSFNGKKCETCVVDGKFFETLSAAYFSFGAKFCQNGKNKSK